MESFRKALLKLYPTQPATSIGQLITFSCILVFSFGMLSFTKVAVLGILSVTLITSFLHAVLAHDHHFRTGFLPPILASLVLQSLFFISGAGVYPWYVILFAMVLNVLPVAFLAAFGAGLASWLLKRGRRKNNEEAEKNKQQRSRFEENIKRLAVVTMFMYLTMQVFVPVFGRVAAAEKQTVDTFIQKYDPEKDYQPATEPIVSPPEGYGVPVNQNGAAGVPGLGASGKLPTWQQVQAQEAKASKTSQLKKQQQTTETLKKKNLSYNELQSLAKQGKITSAQMIALVNNGVGTGKISWWDAAKFYTSGAGRAIQEVGNRIVKAVKPVADWVVQHPWQTAAIVVASVALAAAAVFIPVVGAVVASVIGVATVGLSYLATGVAICTGLYLGYGFLTGGTTGLAKALFAPETLELAAKGDIFGALGSGVVDVFNTLDAMLPIAAVATLPGELAKLPGFIGKVGRAIEAAKEVREIRLIITDTSGLLNPQAFATLKRAFMTAIEEGPEALGAMKAYALSLATDKQAVGMLNNFGEDLETAKQIGNKNLAPVVEKKAEEVVAIAKASTKDKVNTEVVLNRTKVKNATMLPAEKTRKLPLDWDTYVRNNENRIDHVKGHGSNDFEKELQGVFHKDPIKTTNYAWSRKNEIKPITVGNRDVYHIPMKNVGFQGGIDGTYQELDFVTIVTIKDTNIIVTSYPSYGK